MLFKCLWVFWATEYRALLSVVVIFYASSRANTPHTHYNHHQHHCLHSNNLYSPFLSRLSFLANTPYFPTLCLKCHLPHHWHGLPGALDTSTLSNWLIVSHECRISNKNSKVVLLRTMRLSIKVKQKVIHKNQVLGFKVSGVQISSSILWSSTANIPSQRQRAIFHLQDFLLKPAILLCLCPCSFICHFSAPLKTICQRYRHPWTVQNQCHNSTYRGLAYKIGRQKTWLA